MGIRAFIAIALPRHLRDEIRAFQKEITEQKGLETLRFVRPEQLHITLAFFSNITFFELFILQRYLRDSLSCRQAELTPSILSVFNARGTPRVLYAKLEDKDALLTSLSHAICTITHRCHHSFKAHITIGRFKNADKTTAILLQPYLQKRFSSFSCDTLSFYQSRLYKNGPLHCKLAELCF